MCSCCNSLVCKEFVIYAALGVMLDDSYYQNKGETDL